MALGADATIMVSGTNCGGCGTPTVTSSCYTPCLAMPSCTDACGPRLGLLAKIKAKLASMKPNLGCSTSCAAPTCAVAAPVCAPVCETKTCGSPLLRRPIFTGFTTCCADPCSKVSLLDKLKAKFSGLHSCNACAAPAAPTCCGSTVAAAPTTVTTAPATPAAMPK